MAPDAKPHRKHRNNHPGYRRAGRRKVEKDSVSQNPYLLYLTSELKLVVMQHLPARELVKMRAVCRELRHFVDLHSTACANIIIKREKSMIQYDANKIDFLADAAILNAAASFLDGIRIWSLKRGMNIQNSPNAGSFNLCINHIMGNNFLSEDLEDRDAVMAQSTWLATYLVRLHLHHEFVYPLDNTGNFDNRDSFVAYILSDVTVIYSETELKEIELAVPGGERAGAGSGEVAALVSVSPCVVVKAMVTTIEAACATMDGAQHLWR